ncbi:MAG: hypothetical protein FJZ90_01025 [Chloroflexi bacterium]|nr:hypothetical protein [Chloroflexota bacterium]
MVAAQPTVHTGRRASGLLAAFLKVHWALGVLLPAFVVLGLLYAATTPLFEVPGEAAAFRRAAELAGVSFVGELVPDLPDDRGLWWAGEQDGPPLYHLLASLAIRYMNLATPGHPPASSFPPNPYARLWEPEAPVNRNAVLHVEDAAPPYAGIPLAVRLLRAFSVACSALTVAFAYSLSRAVVPHRAPLAAGTAALVAFNPQFLYHSASASGAALATALITIVLYLSVLVVGQAVRQSRRAPRTQARPSCPPTWLPLALGAAAGLAALVKPVGLALLPLTLCAWVMSFRMYGQRDPWRQLLRPLLLSLAAAIVACGWWYVLKALGDKGSSGAGVLRGWWATFGPNRLAALAGATFGGYWGLFGWLNVRPDDLYYTATGVLTILGGAGLAILGGRTYWIKRTLRNHGAQTVLLLVLWVTFVFAGSAWTLAREGGPKVIWLLPAIPAFAYLLSFGITSWFAAPYRPWVVAFCALALFVLAMATPSRYIAPTYARPDRLTLEDMPPESQDLDIAFGSDLYLVGYELADSDLDPGESVRLRLYWLARRRMSYDYVLAVHLHGRSGVHLGTVQTHGGGGSYPTRLWVPGEVVAEEYLMPVPEDTSAPTRGVLRVSVRRLPGNGEAEYVWASDIWNNPLGNEPAIAQLRIGSADQAAYRPREPLEANLGDRAMLYGFDLAPQTPVIGRAMAINLYWECLQPMSQDYTVFVHLVDHAGQLVAQVDEQPIEGDYPTSMWRVGEQIRDVHVLETPAWLAPGAYELRIGLYRLETGERLPIVNADPPTDYVPLWPVHLRGP